MEMGIYEYNLLDTDSQATVLWDKGVFMMNRFEAEYSINLYSLYDFYVEVWYESEENAIHKFRTFKNPGPLEPYLDRIDLNIKL